MEQLRVLIADDDPLARQSLKDQIQALGYQVIGEAASGKQALDLAARLKPDLAILDVKMPDGGGLEAARGITERDRLPVIMLTAFDDEEFVEQADHAGVLAYLLKPAEAKQLKAATKIALARFQELETLRSEVEDLKQALEVRKLVERAKGILMDRLGLSEGDAFKRLQKRARDTNRKLGDVARAVIEANELMQGANSAPR
jgi:response regulator NasT